ncbi:hypothetical protein GCM10007918_03150 [Piscinibacter gummiphilus]|nr:hypothetical protein GCM10007918_03150 [Piscinibacter gummiphilus]
MWKDVVTCLASVGKVLAQWRLASGAKFFMYVPAVPDIGAETLRSDSDVRFEELVQVDIMRIVPLGGLTATNDVEACRRALVPIPYVRVKEVADGIQVRLNE